MKAAAPSEDIRVTKKIVFHVDVSSHDSEIRTLFMDFHKDTNFQKRFKQVSLMAIITKPHMPKIEPTEDGLKEDGDYSFGVDITGVSMNGYDIYRDLFSEFAKGKGVTFRLPAFTD